MIGLHRNNEGEYVMRRNETPTRRENPSGQVVWVARYTGHDGKRRSGGSFPKAGPCKKRQADGKCCAQHRIWHMYELDVPAEEQPMTVRRYAVDVWLQRHPRRERTAAGYLGHVRTALDVETQGGLLGDMAIRDVRAKHLNDLVNVLFREHCRAASGVRAVKAVLSAMFMDAMRDELADTNPAMLITIRDTDPRIRKPRRKVTVATWEQMHEFARAAGPYEPMIRVLADCGLRVGEMFALEHRHDCKDALLVERTIWRGQPMHGTKQGDSRTVPIPPGLRAILDAYPTPLHGPLFPDPKGRFWYERNFARLVWYPAQEATGMQLRPHDFRHSYVSLMRAAGIDPADLASATGHTVMTATYRYTHPMGTSNEAMRRAVAE